MNWQSLIFILIGILIGYGFFVSRSARRQLLASENEAVALYAAALRRLGERMDQLARMPADGSTESDEEMMFALGQAKAFETLAGELRTMADKVEG